MSDATPTTQDFEGRWVIVTGASAGIGCAVAQELSARGAGVVLVGRDETRLAATAASLHGRPQVVRRLDLAQHADIVPAVQNICSEVGPLYGLCHAAGVVETRPLASSNADVTRKQMDVNLVAGLELARAVCRRDVLSPDGASLLFISSVYGLVGMAGQIAYSATKGALAAAARAMAIELARRNVRVNCLSPGFVETEMTRKSMGMLSAEQAERIKALHPLGIGQPQDVARAAAFLLSPSSRWITGVDLPVDGGYIAQ